jgi:hypothetical protein
MASDAMTTLSLVKRTKVEEYTTGSESESEIMAS